MIFASGNFTSLARLVNGAVLWANLILLFWLSLIPFVIRWIDEAGPTPWPVASFGLVLVAGTVWNQARVNRLTQDLIGQAALSRNLQQAALEANVHGLQPELLKILGRLHFRTSYGQNVLAHSIETAFLAGMRLPAVGRVIGRQPRGEHGAGACGPTPSVTSRPPEGVPPAPTLYG